MFDLATIQGGLNAASSAASLLGGLFGGKGKSQSDMMEEQVAWNYHQAEFLPAYQVKGMRRAGLNPMLMATKGVPQGPMPSQSAQDDRTVGIQKASAMAVIANQAAQARLYEAQAKNVEAQTETEKHRPPLVQAQTLTEAERPRLTQAQMQQAGTAADLNRQLEVAAGWETKIKIAETALRNVSAAIAETYGKQMAEEAYKQAKSETGIKSASAVSAAATEAALEKLPAEWVAILRIIKGALAGRQ